MQSRSYRAHLGEEGDDTEMPGPGAASRCTWEWNLPQSLRSCVVGVTLPSWDAEVGPLRH